jgi:hypothetical protein
VDKTRKSKSKWPRPTLKELGEIHGIDPLKIKWSKPMALKDLAHSFSIHRNTLREWLTNQTIRNEQLSPRFWRVAIHDFPDVFS